MRICKNKKAKIEAIIATWMKQEKLPDCLSEYQWNNARSEWERRISSSAIAVSIFLQTKKKSAKRWKELMANYDSELCKFVKINLNADHQTYSWVYPEREYQYTICERWQSRKKNCNIFLWFTQTATNNKCWMLNEWIRSVSQSIYYARLFQKIRTERTE